MFHPFYSRPMVLFQAIYETGSLRKAAETVGLTQPALTKSLQQLEEQLEAALFVRTPKGMVPTEAGDALYRYAYNLKKSAEYAQLEIAGLETGERGLLRIGGGVTWATTVLPKVLSNMRYEFPDLALDLVTGITDQLWQQLENGRIDIMIAAEGHNVPLDPEFVTIPLARVPMTAVASVDHVLAQGGPLPVSRLLDHDWSGFYEDDALIQRAQFHLGKFGLQPPAFVLRSNSFTALMQMVRLSGSIAIISDILVEQAELMGICRIPLDAPLWSLQTNILLRRSALSLKSIQRCIEITRMAISHHRPEYLIS
ncbi:DNA-binding transcriptional LysR family regulator [Aliiruegeria haliotis]|uniref:DNA-binding transcriptional LysR family regulator n=1 Tax=Aliiruegeria haliotis TaxID=1280846 RepID=A0A2T0RFM8_9RHOB|nr:LysR family transcriptional regulator [Aliiruegeria haliotis]PRY19942.1 DNA-binding transcriptional LysR family regulator [Aliiruegeria haliotis]